MRQTFVTITFDTGAKEMHDDEIHKTAWLRHEELVGLWLSVRDNAGDYVYGRVTKVETTTVEVEGP